MRRRTRGWVPARAWDASSLLISKPLQTHGHANGSQLTISRADFLAGQYFDIRLEVHAPVNGSEANGKLPDEKFTFTVAKEGKRGKNATEYFQTTEPKLERWNFTWYEDLYAKDANKPSLVNVTAKAYRRVALYDPGGEFEPQTFIRPALTRTEYTATLTYNGNQKTVATWTVRDIEQVRKTKNVLMFIGDGMTTNMITVSVETATLGICRLLNVV